MATSEGLDAFDRDTGNITLCTFRQVITHDSGVTDPKLGLISSTNPGSRLIAERFFRLGLRILF